VNVDFILVHHDNRDFEILPDYDSRFQPSFNEQTLLFQKDAGVSASCHNMIAVDEASIFFSKPGCGYS
jgi:hypothetical protein